MTVKVIDVLTLVGNRCLGTYQLALGKNLKLEGKLMASNFRIFSLKTSESLHLKLTGDFNGSAAYELINTLTEHSKDFYEIFIDTNDLKSIHPYGKEVFQKKLGALKKQFHGITVFGRNGYKIRAE